MIGTHYIVQDGGFSTPCWLWVRSTLPTGYGCLRRDGRTHYAHRWMYELRRDA